MKLNKNEQRYLLSALRMQIKDVRCQIRTTSEMLKEKNWEPEVRDSLQKDLRDELRIEHELNDLRDRIKNEVAT